MRSLLLLGLLLPLAAQESLLVSTEALAAELSAPRLALLHVGSLKDYQAGHIPGARLVTLPDLSITGPGDLRLELPPIETLRTSLMKLGIANDSRVIIYAGNESVQSATRIWFTMDYLGIPAAMLDGGLAAWKRENRPLQTDTITPTAATTLTITAHPEVLISMVNLHASLNTPTVSLIDARLPEFHTGANKGMMVRAGRIPGPKNVPFPTLLRDSGTFRSFEELREQFGNAPTLVTYCHIGQQTTVPYFAARLAGRKRGEVKLYDGSFQEWSGNAEMPVTVDPQ